MDLSSEFEFATSRSSGPGGQNVNKTETKVEVRFNIQLSQLLSENQKALLLTKLSKKLVDGQTLIATCQETRSQLKNKIIVINKLNTLIEKQLVPKILRVPTKPTKESKEKRILEKKQSGSIKAMRGNLRNKDL